MEREMEEFQPGDEVFIETEEPSLCGCRGIVVEVEQSVILGQVCVVEFHRDMSKHTIGKQPTTKLRLSPKFLKKVNPKKVWLQPEDYDELIDRALAMKDERWFNELTARKEMSQHL